MSRFFLHTYIYIAALMALAVSCVTDRGLDFSVSAEAHGGVTLSLDTSAMTRSEVEMLDSGVLKVYSNGNLVRRYSPISAMPEALYMVAGDYTAQVEFGGGAMATFDVNERVFEGSKQFSIIAGALTEVEIDCELQNGIVEVVFDKTIEECFGENYQFTVSSGVAELVYTKGSTKGYFVIPDGVTSFSWEFRATGVITGAETVLSGSMSAPKSREHHTMTLKYTTYLDITTLKVTIDDSAEEDVDDSLAFSPQPSISGVGFDMNFVQPADGRDYQFSVTSIKALSSVAVEFGGQSVELLRDGALVEGAVGIEGVEYEVLSSMSGLLTIRNSTFASLSQGGANEVVFEMYDESAVAGSGKVTFNVSGVTAPTNIDYWRCSAVLNAEVVVEVVQSVEIAYRPKGTSEWFKVAATKVGDSSYEAVAEPTWSAQTNYNGNKVYTATRDIRSGLSYDYMLIVDGKEYPTSSFDIAAKSQYIPYADMSSSSLPCFGSSASSSTSWASGNNTFVSGLCSHGTKGGESVAELTAKSAVGNFAAGNIIFGQFTFNGIIAQTGTVGFGQPFDWTTRPKSFKVRYAATIGVADFTDSALLPTGSIDQGRIYVAIVDWSERHGTTSGSGSPTGVWDPAKDMELDAGRIIGYGSTFISESTEGDGLHDLEMEIFYYDTETKPSNNITLVISAVTSAYGDYMVGSTSNRMWVKDFEFGY